VGLCNYFQQFTSFKILLVFAFLGLLAYGQTIAYPFVHDDIVFIQQNNRLADFDLAEIFLKKTSSSSPVINTYYRPALEVLTRAQYRLFDRNPAGYHLFNILLHIANGFLVYLLAGIFFNKKKGLAFAVGLLFLSHPVQTEAVACVAGVSNLLFTFLCLISFYLYVKAQRQKGWGCYGLSLCAFFLSLLAKEQAVVLPLLVLFYEFCFARDSDREKGFRRVGGYAGVVMGYFLLRKVLIGGALPAVMFNQELGLNLQVLGPAPGFFKSIYGLIIFFLF